ncbi:ATP-dependent helicase [Marinilabiliaceae bacterium JC040]|nr:ATP-dependent helicase [Marinilabiliaceae bacterium JC040]
MFVWNKDELNSEQEKAIFEQNSVLLVACPGSGKTRTLIYKIAYELSRLKSEKEFIIAITYTNAAADEIKDRVELLGVDVTQLWIGTIHSFCLEWILRPYSLYLDELKNGFSVINSYDAEELLEKLCKSFEGNKLSLYDCGYIATHDKFILMCKDKFKHKNIRAVLTKYFNILKQNNQIDFEMILAYSFKILKKRPVISQILSKLFPFILIDEYQDTKEIQYHIISSILKAGNSKSRTLIVGDPNQAIYDSLGGFPMSKSDLELLFGFKLTIADLSKNYRSSSKIINYFNAYKTYDNKILSVGKNKDYNSLITFNNTIHKDNLVDEIVNLVILNIKDKHISQNEICIAAPQWYPLASLTRNLMVRLPECSFDGPGMSPFARDIDNFWYKLSRIVLTEPSPNLYIRRLRWSTEVLNELSNFGVEISDFTNKGLLRFCNSVSIDEEEGLEYLRIIFDKICVFLKISIPGFPILKEHYDSFFRSSEKRIEKLQKEGNEFVDSISNFKKVFKQREGITVSTIHGIKGEEYDTVIGFGILEGWVPHFSDKINGAKNSKKMLYVLSSRARKNLHLISEIGRNVNNYNPTGLKPTSHLLSYDFKYDEI